MSTRCSLGIVGNVMRILVGLFVIALASDASAEPVYLRAPDGTVSQLESGPEGLVCSTRHLDDLLGFVAAIHARLAGNA